MKDKDSLKIERDRLVKVCKEKNLKVKREGRTVKQQIVVMNKAIGGK